MYVPQENERIVLLGNSHTTRVMGTSEVDLHFTYGRSLLLKDVLHTPDMRKKLVSGFLLNKVSFRQVVESDQYVITKNDTFVGRGYAFDNMFKLNVEMNASSSVNAWHTRLSHINGKYVRNISRLGLIPYCKVRILISVNLVVLLK
ncbi:hypothetical protein Pint_30647 [Pistacia integerrima]|uniref:Uncharacterized protein n=1 Tax=Pistacia integerrima TaxID=434235 RepID=A0ACC0WXY8_9ROSI|nr:hypothetical protein Pint_30647 [Pistacia integerrima]